MKKGNLGIGVILGLVLIALYELTISAYGAHRMERELALLTARFKSDIENRLLKSLHVVEHLSALCRYNSHLTENDFRRYSENQAKNHLEFIQLQYADSRFDSLYTYLNDAYVSENIVQDGVAIKLDYSGLELKRAVELEAIALQDPFLLEDGTRCIAYWSPIFGADRFLGMVTGIVSLENIFSHLLEDEIYQGISVSVIDGADNVLYGSWTGFEGAQTAAVTIADRLWYIGARWNDTRENLPSGRRLTLFFAAACLLVFWGGSGFWSTRHRKNLLRQNAALFTEIEGLQQSMESEKQRMEETREALRRSEERYRALFDNNPIQTIVVDTNCRIVMYNFARHRVEGRKPVIGGLMYKDYAEHHEIDMFSELLRCIEHGEQREFPELKYRERYLRIHISPFSDGAIITSIDVTATKKYFDQLQHSHKMEAIGTLAGGIAHEFNNVLGIILGNVELAADELEKKEVVKECLEEVKRASMRAKDVVRQLLSFSRKKYSKKSPVRIGELVEDAIRNLVRPSIPTSIELYCSIERNVPMIMADSLQIQQVLINLCGNSAQSMPDERGEIHVEVKELVLHYDRPELYKHIGPGHYVQLTVRDNGRGIEERIHDKIFTPYFTTKEHGQGVGMGLAIVHGIVNDHGGEIVFESGVRAGTTMHLLFQPIIGHTPHS